jgi:hypothetical protein
MGRLLGSEVYCSHPTPLARVAIVAVQAPPPSFMSGHDHEHSVLRHDWAAIVARPGQFRPPADVLVRTPGQWHARLLSDTLSPGTAKLQPVGGLARETDDT